MLYLVVLKCKGDQYYVLFYNGLVWTLQMIVRSCKIDMDMARSLDSPPRPLSYNHLYLADAETSFLAHAHCACACIG